jgi:hypothetical protein
MRALAMRDFQNEILGELDLFPSSSLLVLRLCLFWEFRR